MNESLISRHLAISIALGLVAWVTCAAEPLRLVGRIELNVTGRIDHMAVDATNHRLFLAALGNNSLEVVDLRAGKVIHSIGGLHEPQGVAFLKEENRIAVADGGDGTCRFFDATTYISNGSHGFQSDADNLRYDPIEKRLYVGFGGGAIGRIDMSNGKRLDDIQLSGHPESFQLERNGTRVYVNVPAARRIAVIDRQRAKVVATWPVLAEANFPMALDEEGHRLFVGCRRPASIVVYDTRMGKATSHFASAGDADDLFYDRKTRRLYVSGGEGFIFVHQQEDNGRFSQLAKIRTASGARTSLLVPELRHFFLAVPRRGAQPSELRVYEVALP